jgi:hypothetical protein
VAVFLCLLLQALLYFYSQKKTGVRGAPSVLTTHCVAVYRFAASGQFGLNSDCVVWDFEGRRLLYRLSEHDHGVVSVAFSHDEKLLATVGHEQDNKILVWDMSNGYIVSVSSPAMPSPCTCVCWGGMTRDIKRRDTNSYQLATCGNKQIALWSLDPYQGEMVGEKVVAEGRGSQVRQYTTLGFSEDRETLYAGTTSGDFVVARGKSSLGLHTFVGFFVFVFVSVFFVLNNPPTSCSRLTLHTVTRTSVFFKKQIQLRPRASPQRCLRVGKECTQW